MESKAKEILVQSFVFSNFNYCPSVWRFSSEKSMKKIEKIHERALRFLYHDSTSSYDDSFSEAGKCSMKISRLRTLCIEIYKTVSNNKVRKKPITDQTKLLSGPKVSYH